MVRVRIAPSPTGYAHFGFARTALFNYLFAKKHEGAFVVRIEDTDKERSKKEYEEEILSDLRWLGISWEEGPDVGGPYGPYRQSERSHIYSNYLKKLSEEGRLYKCYCTKEELEQEKLEQTAAKMPPRYSGKCRSLSQEQQAVLERQGRVYTLRFLLQPEKISINDLIRGTLHFDTALMDDFIIAKDFDAPLYNFAVVIDDALMNITHVIRGEEHISNTPKQVQLAAALGLSVPQFGHLPLILDSDRKKMSKRENKTALCDYRNEGYLPEALLNFMALLGWNPGGDRELYTLVDLEKIFDLSHVNKAGSIFDVQKLDWFNAHYIRHADLLKIVEQAIPYFISAGFIVETGHLAYSTADGEVLPLHILEKIVDVERQRIKKVSEIALNASLYFDSTLSYEPELLQWKEATRDDTKLNLKFVSECLHSIAVSDWDMSNIEIRVKDCIKKNDKKNGHVLWPLRVALSGLKASPGPFEIASILGKAKTLERINLAIEKLS